MSVALTSRDCSRDSPEQACARGSVSSRCAINNRPPRTRDSAPSYKRHQTIARLYNMHALLQTMVVAQRCKFNALFVTLSTPIGYSLRIIEHLFISTGLSSNRSSYTNRELHYYFGIRVVRAFIVYYGRGGIFLLAI